MNDRLDFLWAVKAASGEKILIMGRHEREYRVRRLFRTPRRRTVRVQDVLLEAMGRSAAVRAAQKVVAPRPGVSISSS